MTRSATGYNSHHLRAWISHRMDSTLKQRLIGAAVLAALAVIFLPMLLKGPDVSDPDAAEVPLIMPATPDQEFETRELPLTAPVGGVVGMAAAPEAGNAQADENSKDPDAALTAVDASGSEAAEPGLPVADAPAPASVASITPTKPPVPAPAPEPLPAPEVAAGNYAVNVGTFRNLDSANALVAKLRAAKLPVIAERVSLDSGSAMRVRVGPYPDRAVAEAARLRAEGVSGSAAKVIVLDADVVKSSAPATAAPAKPAAAAPVPAKPAVISAGFAVQLSAPSIEADALALRDRARAAGFSSFVQRIETDSGPRFRVRIGPVADRSAAETMLESANGKLGIKGIIVTNP
jgi:DedD protein